jgi:ABC-type dipeptide/oligopeptide/nickel transport system ATPase component
MIAASPAIIPVSPGPIPWKQGEHMAIIGDTGSGKTFLEARLIAMRDYAVVCRTKPDDIKFPGFKTVHSASAMDSLDEHRLLLTPKYERQAVEIAEALTKAWEQGHWTIAIDELYYATTMLKLEPYVNRLLTQGRSKRITVITGMQRPAWISRFALSQSTHTFLFVTEGRDTKTIAQALSPRLADVVSELRKHEFSYFHRPSRTIRRGYAQNLQELITKA